MKLNARWYSSGGSGKPVAAAMLVAAAAADMEAANRFSGLTGQHALESAAGGAGHCAMRQLRQVWHCCSESGALELVYQLNSAA